MVMVFSPLLLLTPWLVSHVLIARTYVASVTFNPPYKFPQPLIFILEKYSKPLPSLSRRRWYLIQVGSWELSTSE